jgi:hypothetical protein
MDTELETVKFNELQKCLARNAYCKDLSNITYVQTEFPSQNRSKNS